MGQTCTVSLLGVGERYFQEGRKTEKFFVRNFSKFTRGNFEHLYGTR